MPEGLSPEEQLLFLELRSLYSQCKVGIISRETGVAEKKKLIRAFEERKRLNSFRDGMLDHAVKLWDQAAGLTSEYRKAPSLDLADRIVRVIYGELESIT